jgi:hypothetical protein
LDKTPGRSRQTLFIKGDAVLVCGLSKIEKKGDQAAIPMPKLGHIELKRPNAGSKDRLWDAHLDAV